jgi:putative effector of murein hydrolase
MLGPGFGERILDAIIRFQQRSRNFLAGAFVGSLVIVLIAYWLEKHFWISNLLILCYSLPAVTSFLVFDLSRHMNRTPDIQLGREGVGW